MYTQACEKSKNDEDSKRFERKKAETETSLKFTLKQSPKILLRRVPMCEDRGPPKTSLRSSPVIWRQTKALTKAEVGRPHLWPIGKVPER